MKIFEVQTIAISACHEVPKSRLRTQKPALPGKGGSARQADNKRGINTLGPLPHRLKKSRKRLRFFLDNIVFLGHKTAQHRLQALSGFALDSA